MNKLYEEVKSKAFSAFRALSREYPPFEDAKMLVGSADTSVSLTRSKISKTIDTEWIEKIEKAIPSLDVIIRNPSVAIEDVDEILPVELSKHITEKSIKHLAQHTNYILDIKDGEVIPQKILNVFHEETSLTYENKFVNTLLSRLSAFVDKRLGALNSASGIEMDYKFDYSTEFEHFVSEDGGRNSARINLRIEMTSPLGRTMSESDIEINERYIEALNRVKRINMALISYRSSAFAQKLGRNYVRPPIIRTNAILKNKNLRECLNLWEYIEAYEKVGYSFIADRYYEMPSSDFVGGMYSSVALQYLTLYSGIADELEDNRLISEKHLFETMPEFDDEIENEDIDDYLVYDSEYKKTVPVSRLMNNRKKLSEDEKKIRRAIIVALKADEIINEPILREEAERRRLEREKRLLEEAEAKRLREEEEARRLAEEEAARLAREEEERLAAAALSREVEIRYRRSFLSRYIQAESYIQDYYTEIKNELLSYKGVKARTSWSKESFKQGRTHIAKIDVKGKSLYLYLALDPKTLEGTKYRVTEAKGECPALIKIKSERKKKYALELIRMLMEKLGLQRISREACDYRLPYEDTDALIERGLIKVILPKGEQLDENSVTVKANLSGLSALRKETAKEDASETDTEGEQSVLAEIPAEEVEENAKTEANAEHKDNPESEVSAEIEVSAESEDDAKLKANADGEENAEINSNAQLDSNAKTDSAGKLVEIEIAEEPLKEESQFSEEAVRAVEELAKIEDEGSFDEQIDVFINSVVDMKADTVVSSGRASLAPKRTRTASQKREFAFMDSDAEPGAPLIPYTRKEYLALPRKKKKSVLMSVKKLIRYEATKRLCEALRALDSENPRILSRIEKLEARLAAEEKLFPISKVWENAVKRLKNDFEKQN